MKKENLAIAVMHLISIEEHLAFTALKTKKNEYLEILQEVRKLRKKLQDKLEKNKEGEMHCVNKHLLAATLRLLEVAESGDKHNNFFLESAFDLYSLFWFLQKIGEKNDVKKSGKKVKKMER